MNKDNKRYGYILIEECVHRKIWFSEDIVDDKLYKIMSKGTGYQIGPYFRIDVEQYGDLILPEACVLPFTGNVYVGEIDEAPSLALPRLPINLWSFVNENFELDSLSIELQAVSQITEQLWKVVSTKGDLFFLQNVSLPHKERSIFLGTHRGKIPQIGEKFNFLTLLPYPFATYLAEFPRYYELIGFREVTSCEKIGEDFFIVKGIKEENYSHLERDITAYLTV